MYTFSVFEINKIVIQKTNLKRMEKCIMNELQNNSVTKRERSGDLMAHVSDLFLIASYSVKEETAVRKNLWLAKSELTRLVKEFWENSDLENSIETFMEELEGVWITIQEQDGEVTELLAVEHSNIMELLKELIDCTNASRAELLYKYLGDTEELFERMIFHEVYPCEESEEQIKMGKFVLLKYKQEALLTRNNQYDDISFKNYWMEPDTDLIPAHERANKILLDRLHQTL